MPSMMEGRIKIIVVLIFWLAILAGCLAWFMGTQVQRVAIAGGERGSECLVARLSRWRGSRGR